MEQRSEPKKKTKKQQKKTTASEEEDGVRRGRWTWRREKQKKEMHTDIGREKQRCWGVKGGREGGREKRGPGRIESHRGGGTGR
jgi:hypothetical protein